MMIRFFLTLPILLVVSTPGIAQSDNQQSNNETPKPMVPQVVGEPVPKPPKPVEETVLQTEWLEAMKARMPEHICQDQGQWLGCFGLEPSACPEEANKISELCLDILSQNMPEQLTETQAGQWGVEAARCFNLTFMNLYRENLKDDESCQSPPAHLR